MLLSFLLLEAVLSCDRFLMNSVIPGFGRGIYAGRNYQVAETVEISPSLLIKNEFAMENQLQYFVYATEDEFYDAIVFGEGMMYNSLDIENVVHEWASGLPGFDSIYDKPFTNYTFFKYTIQRNVRIGEEFFVNYGDGWFQQRSLNSLHFSDIPKRRYSLLDLQKYGFCLSDTYISDSAIPLSGRGLFSRKSFRKGDTVMMSPVLVLPREDVESTADSSVLMNYCLTTNQSNVALLPISVGGMINHGGINSNVEIMWESDSSTTEHLSQPASILASLNFAPLTIKYVAKRPIISGEEITISYGQEWEEKWLEYLSSLKLWNQQFGAFGHYMKPQFRKMIEAPFGLFPPTFFGNCFGKRCELSLENEKHQEYEAEIIGAIKYAESNFLLQEYGNVKRIEEVFN